MSVTDGDGPASHDGRAYVLQIYPRLSLETALCCKLQVHKEATAAAVIQDAAASLGLDRAGHYVLAEVKESGGEEWVLEATDLPVHRVLLWPRKAQDEHPQSDGFYFLLQERNRDGSICYVHLQGAAGAEADSQRLVARGFLPPRQEDVADLCNLPTLTEDTILENLRRRFKKKKIYTYAGSILVAINPFKFLPIYNPKYVKMYENHQLGKLEPHIFAIADVSYYAMLRKRINQCIVISGESGSGKTQSTNFLIHCLTALSQKGYASGVERTILGAGPVLEAFGNAKTAHNNNSSRFGKFIQVNYLESGVVRGAVVEKYLLEKSRLVSREKNERNYHVFYYLLVGASEAERKEYKLLQPEDYYYLKQQSFAIEDADDLRHDFERLQQAMEMVGFLPATKRQIFSVLSAILYLGNVTYRRKSTGREEGLDAGPPEVLANLSDLLKVKEELLVEALTKRKTVTVNDKLILPYSHSEAITARDSMAKSLYSALFDWIVLRINHALLNKKDMEESVECLSIGVLDIFGFEDFATNSFEQFCINYANEQLQYYFNQHIFTLEQEEYQMEGITWHNIDYTDNVGCIHLISKKPTGLLYLLDEESNFPHATDKTLLAKFKQQHERNAYFVPTPVMEPAFVILHFAGKVKYQIKDFREKNTDHMRPDIVALLRSSNSAYVRHLIGMDPVAMFRWGILRSALRALAAFNEAGRRRAAKSTGVVRPISRVPLGELQRANTSIERMYRDMHAQIINSIKDLQLDGEDPRKLLQSWGPLRFPRHLFQKNKGTKTKQLIPKNLLDSRSLKFIVGLHDRTTKSLLHLHKKKKPPSISAQFQTSLSKLLETLGKAEPFFIRCIRSNAEKKEMCFDEALVLQQLCYTGMLETVRIRRSGYGAKYTFQEFIGQFRVLLPRKAPSQEDISTLLQNLGLDSETYQIGKTKVYLKEPERQKLLDALHKDVMRKIIFLQRWFRAKLQRRHFLQLRAATVFVQRSWRVCQQRRCWAASRIQATWRGSRQRAVYRHRRTSVTKIQALVRGQSAQDHKDLKASTIELPGETSPKTADTVFPEELTGSKITSTSSVPERASTCVSPKEDKGPQPGSPATLSEACRPKAPPMSKLTTSRSQEKRELRRQRGLEHSHRESVRAASVGKDEPVPKPESRHAERTDNRELDQYTFVAWKVEKAKKESKDEGEKVKRDTKDRGEVPEREAKEAAACPVRPTVLALEVPGSKPERSHRSELPGLPGTDTQQAASKPSAAKDTAGVEKSRSSSGQPESSPPASRNQGDKKHKMLQYGLLWKLLPTRRPCPDLLITLQNQKLSCTCKIGTSLDKSIFIFFLSLALSCAHTHTVPCPSRPHHLEPPTGRLSRNPTIKISRATRVTEQWNASLDREITNANELRHLDEFLGNQVNDLRSRGKQLSGTENIFITATMQFRENIKSMYSLPKPHTGYKGLMRSYQKKVISLAGEKQKGEVQLVVNLFQSVLDGFIRGEIKREEAEPAKPPKGRKKRRKKDKNSPLDHMFTHYQVNVMQSCDQCSSYIWGMEKAYMCSCCRMVCHKKCLSKIVTDCSTFCSKKEDSGSQHFGVRVIHLTSDKVPVPVVLEIMLEHVEMNGLYTEGIYRKSGSANRMKELRQLLEADPNKVCLEDYPIHAVTGLVKQWLRELPDPLMTFHLYNDFLHAVELPEKLEQVHAIYRVVEQLPQANFCTLERLIFHLVRVSREEKSNRMTPNSLAIVFAPCILRGPDSDDPLLSMKDVAKTTTCVEMLINEQIKSYNEKMEEIEQLEFAEALAKNQLKLKRNNTVSSQSPAQRLLHTHHCSFQLGSDLLPRKELACRLPDMEQPGSDQENQDSEASASSDSLLDERALVAVPRTPNPACSAKATSSPSTQCAPLGGVSSPTRSTPRDQLQRRLPIIPRTVRLPPGVLTHPAVQSLPPRKAKSLTLVQRRTQPSRRKDSVQSLFVGPGAELFFPPV
uniref:Myosin IXB n=1 Tax=Electrophorus electricus TaxID=8005 RepID=A0A4W4FEF2_ELEEL